MESLGEAMRAAVAPRDQREPPDPIIIEAMAHWLQHCPMACRRLVKLGPHALRDAVQKARDRQLHAAAMLMARIPYLDQEDAMQQTRNILFPVAVERQQAWTNDERDEFAPRIVSAWTD